VASPGQTSVVIPAFNEAGAIGDVVSELLRSADWHEVLVIDDGSGDGTAEAAAAAGARVIRHPYNKGNGASVKSGIRAASGEYILVLDADGQHRPADLPRLLAALADADLVVGARRRSAAMPPHRRLGNALSAAFLGALAGTPLPDVQSGYRAHRHALLDALGLVPRAAGDPRPRPPAFRSTGYGFESEILVAAARLGFRVSDVPIEAVYEGAPSHFHPGREVPRFVALYARLFTDAARWSRHRAAAAAAARDPETA
jgi:glycosyltransferase involved in cell wall biosynthesis